MIYTRKFATTTDPKVDAVEYNLLPELEMIKEYTGTNKTEIGKKIGLTAGRISNIMNGVKDGKVLTATSLSTVCNVAHAFGGSVSITIELPSNEVENDGT